jgi:anti-sigma regulatory factor (Ser/Thr protein kinase)
LPPTVTGDTRTPVESPPDPPGPLATRAHWTFDIHDGGAAASARRSFLRALRTYGAAGSDFEAAEMIFSELIGNVARYAPGPVDVMLDWKAVRPTLHVIDDGPGFEARPSLPGDPYAETGRGLYIVSSLGADLRAEREPGRGARVRVTLPVDRLTGRRRART